MKLINYFSGLSSKDRTKMIFGFIRVAFERQRGYMAWATPILLIGLYGTKIKVWIIHFVSNYWIIFIPLWILFIFFDMFILLPGEQMFYSKSNKIIMNIYNKTK